MLNQAQVIGRPTMKSWDDYEAGCLSSFGGGHHTDGHLEAFQHGMSTVFNLLRNEFPPAALCKAAPELRDAVALAVLALDIYEVDGNYTLADCVYDINGGELPGKLRGILAKTRVDLDGQRNV